MWGWCRGSVRLLWLRHRSDTARHGSVSIQESLITWSGKDADEAGMHYNTAAQDHILIMTCMTIL